MLRIPCWVYTGVHSGYNQSSVAFSPRKGVYYRGVHSENSPDWQRPTAPNGRRPHANRTPVGEPIGQRDHSDERVPHPPDVQRRRPYTFDDTLYYSLTLTNQDAPRDELDRVCLIATVDEFLRDLRKGYDTELKGNGVSNEQRHERLVDPQSPVRAS